MNNVGTWSLEILRAMLHSLNLFFIVVGNTLENCGQSMEGLRKCLDRYRIALPACFDLNLLQNCLGAEERSWHNNAKCWTKTLRNRLFELRNLSTLPRWCHTTLAFVVCREGFEVTISSEPHSLLFLCSLLFASEAKFNHQKNGDVFDWQIKFWQLPNRIMNSGILCRHNDYS